MLTSRDFQSAMAVITSTYPNCKLDLNNPTQMGIWFENLSDLDPMRLALAIKNIVATSEFPPTIATIRKKCAEMDMPDRVDNEQAWGMVMKAISNYGYMRAQEAMESLPQQVQKAVTWVGGFKSICESENVDVIRGQFNKAMASVNSREYSNKAMGEQLCMQIEQHTTQSEQRQQARLETTYSITPRPQDKETLERMENVRDIVRRVCG